MKFSNTIKAARSVEETTWAVAEGLVADFRAAGVTPTTLEFKEAAEALERDGHDYTPNTLGTYWRVAATFTRRRAGVPVTIYAEILSPLWARLPSENRDNDLRAYAANYFKSGNPISFRAARAWAKAQANALDSERKAANEAAAKAKAEADLEEAEALLQQAVEAGNRDQAEAVLPEVNDLRGRLGMDLLELEQDETTGEVEITPDEEATEESKNEAKRAEARQYAVAQIEAALANVGMKIRALKYDYTQYAKFLAQDDLDAYADEIDGLEGELALIRAEFSGAVSDEALAAALAEWSSETHDQGGSNG